MIFQAHSKGLRLVVTAGTKEVDKSAGIPVITHHPQKEIRFDLWRYETEDPEEIIWLKRHRMFSEVAGAPSTFWVFVPPRNFEAELAAEKTRAAELEAENARLKAAQSSPQLPAQPQAAPEEPPKPEVPFCDSCDSKGGSHKKICPKNPKNAAQQSNP